jgi:hypothetical protein
MRCVCVVVKRVGSFALGASAAKVASRSQGPQLTVSVVMHESQAGGDGAAMRGSREMASAFRASSVFAYRSVISIDL